MRRALAACGLWGAAAIVCGFTVVRDPNSQGTMRHAGDTITVRIQQDGSDDVSNGADIDAMRASLAAWSVVPNSALRLVDGGLSPTGGRSCDGVNRISFRETGWPVASGVVAFTEHCWTGATIDEGDILVNGEGWEWGVDGNFDQYDIQSTVTHELGHVIGLHHAADPQATMFFAGRRGMTYARTLHPDDLAAVRFLYPSGAFSCGGDSDCPLLAPVYGPMDGTAGGGVRLRCSGGTCVPGAVPYGSDCYVDTDCNSTQCVRDPLNSPSGDDPGGCSQICGSCPGGDWCDAGTCLLGRDDCRATNDPSDPCSGPNVACTRGLDGRFRCNKLCVQDSQCGSLPGTICFGEVGTTTPGFCLVPGATTGGSCGEAGDCASLVCTTNALGAPVCEPTAGGDGGPPGLDGGPTQGDSEIPGGDGGPPELDAGPTGGDSEVPSGGDPLRTVRGGDATIAPLVSGCHGAGDTSWAGVCACLALLAAVRRRKRSGT